jgi:outer membrane immunogenic protein
MNKLLLAATALMATIAGPALAADMAVKAPLLKAPAPAFSWTACYLGANGGGAWTQTTMSHVPDGGDYGKENSQGYFGGAQVGCDYQSGIWVFGVKGQASFGDSNRTHVVPANPALQLTDYNNINAIYTATGRIGITPIPTGLLYVQAGGAWLYDEQEVSSGVSGLFERGNAYLSGWVVGVGAEREFLTNWSLFAEVNYMSFGTKNVPFTLASGPGPADILATKANVESLLFGLNYRFGAGGPVVARY